MIRCRALVPFASLAAALVITAGAADTTSAQAPKAAPEPLISLFDGKSLKGWRGYKKPDASATRWTVENGMLTLPARSATDKRSGDIITTETYDFFELTWDWKVATGGNSGLKYFVLEDLNSAIGHEYQLIDDAVHADAKIGPHRQTAAFYDVLPAKIPAAATRPAGEWNSSKVRVAPSRVIPGSTRVSHVLNGATVLEYELDSPELRAAIAKSKFKDVARFGKPQKGHILLQDHADEVWFRAINIQKLPSCPSECGQ